MDGLLLEFREAVGLVSDVAIIGLVVVVWRVEKRVSRMETIEEVRARQ